MIVIGIAGGIASGKSLVAKQLSQLGAVVLDADRVGHQVLREPEVIREIRDYFGDDVFGADGQVDRRRMASVVFEGADAQQHLLRLEQITHPRIRTILIEQIQRLSQEDVPAVVLDAPVMFKSDWSRFCDVILFVDVPLSIRQQRCLERGWSVDELRRREGAQLDLAEKRKRSNFTIDNSNSAEETFSQLKRIWNQIVPLSI
jgi:dephospho-CoA kinase